MRRLLGVCGLWWCGAVRGGAVRGGAGRCGAVRGGVVWCGMICVVSGGIRCARHVAHPTPRTTPRVYGMAQGVQCPVTCACHACPVTWSALLQVRTIVVPRPSTAAGAAYPNVSLAVQTAVNGVFRGRDVDAVLPQLEQDLVGLLSAGAPATSDLVPYVVLPALAAVLVGLSLGMPLFCWWRVRALRQVGTAPRQGPCAVVFTDIQSSSLLWGRISHEMVRGLDIHHSVIRDCIRRHKAYEVKTIGDSFMIAVHTPAAALRLTLDIQASTRPP